jgi:hypothetical protein
MPTGRYTSRCTACGWQFVGQRGAGGLSAKGWCPWCSKPSQPIGNSRKGSFDHDSSSQSHSFGGAVGGKLHRWPKGPAKPSKEPAGSQHAPVSGASLGSSGTQPDPDDEVDPLGYLDKLVLPSEVRDLVRAAHHQHQEQPAPPTDMSLHIARQRLAKATRQVEGTKAKYDEIVAELQTRLERQSVFEARVRELEVALRVPPVVPPTSPEASTLRELLALLSVAQGLPPEVVSFAQRAAQAGAAPAPAPSEAASDPTRTPGSTQSGPPAAQVAAGADDPDMLDDAEDKKRTQGAFLSGDELEASFKKHRSAMPPDRHLSAMHP